MPTPDPDSTCDGTGFAVARANRLVPLFFEDSRQFGEILEVGSSDVPEPHRRLLDHRSHMTVTMEAFVGGSLGLKVLRERPVAVSGDADATGLYAREIMLLAPSGEAIQYGIVRVDLAALLPDVRERILTGSAPLGRVLIEAGTLRDVHDVELVRIAAGQELARRIGVESGRTLYGRVAAISVASGSLATGSPQRGLPARTAPAVDPAASLQPSQVSRPAVELLEIPLVG